uniref:Uncharacterized protein n=1 Tax=Anopheles triannulatus TaxID=58253 RepID=A0A2M4B527_9DIPT
MLQRCWWWHFLKLLRNMRLAVRCWRWTAGDSLRKIAATAVAMMEFDLYPSRMMRLKVLVMVAVLLGSHTVHNRSWQWAAVVVAAAAIAVGSSRHCWYFDTKDSHSL